MSARPMLPAPMIAMEWSESTLGALSACPASIKARQPHALEPERLDLADDLLELVEVDGLGDVAVGMVLVTKVDVRLGGGRRQDDHRNPPELGIFLDLPEDLAAMLAGKVQIEEHQVGPRRSGVRALTAQKGHGLDPVLDDVDLGLGAAAPERYLSEVDVGRIVLDEEDVSGSRVDSHGKREDREIPGMRVVNPETDAVPRAAFYGISALLLHSLCTDEGHPKERAACRLPETATYGGSRTARPGTSRRSAGRTPRWAR